MISMNFPSRDCDCRDHDFYNMGGFLPLLCVIGLNCHVNFSFAPFAPSFSSFAGTLHHLAHLIKRRSNSLTSVTVLPLPRRCVDGAAHSRCGPCSLFVGHRKHDGFRALQLLLVNRKALQVTHPWQHAKDILKRPIFRIILNWARKSLKNGPLENILGMLPGMSNLQGLSIDEKQLKRTEAIVLSMTNEERTRPGILECAAPSTHRPRSGSTVTEVNELLRRFDQMAQDDEECRQNEENDGANGANEKLTWQFHPITQRRGKKPPIL